MMTMSQQVRAAIARCRREGWSVIATELPNEWFVSVKGVGRRYSTEELLEFAGIEPEGKTA